MAVRIGLTATDPALIEEASPLDMDMAVGTLRAVVKASAYCLEHLPSPKSHRAEALMEKYRDSVHQARVFAQLPNLDDHQILVPSNPSDIPAGKVVAKINLAHMAPGLPAQKALQCSAEHCRALQPKVMLYNCRALLYCIAALHCFCFTALHCYKIAITLH